MTWTRERWQRIDALFHELVEVDASERPGALAAKCGDDADLRAAVQKLLDADTPAAESLLDRGIVSVLHGRDPLLDQRFGAFRLVERIAEGGMGVVYRATRVDGDFAQEVAVKVLRLGLSTTAMTERFAHERQTLARLVHPNVARLLDGGATAQGVPFFAMELVEGVPIDRYCDERRATLRQRLALFVTVCHAVQFAHQNLVVHLDLKPSNILVDTHGAPKLVDFGVAGLLGGLAAEESSIAVTRTRPLTPEYASPELLRGEPVTTSADVYSLGVVLYELLTGSRAFRPTRSALELMRAVCDTDAVRPSTTFTASRADGDASGPTAAERAHRRSASVGDVARMLRGDLDRIVAKAMQRSPELRYASCRELAEDIERHLGGFPVLARESTTGYRFRKFVRRHAVPVAVTGVVLLALLGGVVSTLRMARIAQDERDLAAKARLEAEKERDAASAAQRRSLHEAEHARIEASSNHLVADFLGETFLSAQFLGNERQRERVLTTIRRRAELARRQLQADRHLRANFVHALGRAAMSLDAFDVAEELLREAAEVRRGEFGAESLEYAVSLGSLGQLYYRQDRLPEAAAALREAYRLHREMPKDVHTDVALAANDLAATERALGNVDRARELHREALALRREGGQAALIAESLNNIAGIEPDPTRAREMLDESWRLRREVLGDDHPLTIQSESNLGVLLLNAREFAAAREHLRSAVARSRDLGDPGLDGLSASLRSLAYAELQLGDVATATAEIGEAIAIDRRRFGDTHLRVAGDLGAQAAIFERSGQWASAAGAWRESLRIRRALLPPANRLVATDQMSLGTALIRSGEVKEGVELVRGAALLMETAEPRRVVDIVDVQTHLGLAEEASGRPVEAEAAFARAFELAHGHAEAASRTKTARSHLREFYRRQGREADAARIGDG